MNFGISANFGGNFNAGIGGGVKIGGNFSSSSFTSVTTTTVVTVNTNISLEATIRTQYQEKVDFWQKKYNETQAQITDLNKRLKTAETEKSDQRRSFEEEKNKLEFHVQRIRNERNEAKDRVAVLEKELSDLKNANNGWEKTIIEQQQTIAILQDKVNRAEEDRRKKSERMAEMEGELQKAKTELEFENLDDLQMEQVIAKQNEIIQSLNIQLQTFYFENQKDDAQILQYEGLLKQREEEINFLKKDIESLNSKYNSNTYIQIDMINTCSIFIELETKYQLIDLERHNLENQLKIKNQLVADLENRIRSQNDKYIALNKSFNDLRGQIDIYERREVELKKSVDDYRLQYELVVQEVAIKDTKISGLDSLNKVKDDKIKKLMDMIKERDTRIAEIKAASQKSQEELENTKSKLNEKLLEVARWKKENDQDDAKIQELLDTLTEQKRVISEWEEENRRDDKRIAELEDKCHDYESFIEFLKDEFNEMREKANEFCHHSINFSIIDESMKSSTITKFKQEVQESSQYLEVQERLNFAGIQIKTLLEEINDYRSQLDIVLQDKNFLFSECEALRKQLDIERGKVQTASNIKNEFATRFESQYSILETERSNFLTANTLVTNFKGECSGRRDEFVNMFNLIESVLHSK